MSLTLEEKLEQLSPERQAKIEERAEQLRTQLHILPPPFVAFPKIPRLYREIVITEKIDGTNACVHVAEDGTIRAGSRTRWITPENDNMGFAAWVFKHASELAKLGPGTHYGEWWGGKIQRGYGCAEKTFSLFNVSRWEDPEVRPSCCSVVPRLYTGPFREDEIRYALETLRLYGSQAAPGFKNPEGIIVFHTASSHLYKILLENDDVAKGQVAELSKAVSA